MAVNKSNSKPVRTASKLNYAEIEFDEDTQGMMRPVIRGEKPEPTNYTEVFIPSLKDKDSIDKVQPIKRCATPPTTYENVDVPDGHPPGTELFKVLEEHHSVSMSAARLNVQAGDIVLAEKVEPGRRALCCLQKDQDPGAPRGWIPVAKLRAVDPRAPNMILPSNSKLIPITVDIDEDAPTVPPKSPDLLSSPKQSKHHTAHLNQVWFVGKMSRDGCETTLRDTAKDGNFILRESTYRVGDFTLSVRYEGRVHHFPIKTTEDEKYYIGKHKFKNLCHVITYYQGNPLFFNDKHEAVSLGEPFGQVSSSC